MKFLIQFETGADTKWLYPVGDTVAALRFCAASVAQAHTSGAIPAVTVIEEQAEAPAPCEHQWKPGVATHCNQQRATRRCEVCGRAEWFSEPLNRWLLQGV
jgi:hypothetical protein